MIRALVTTLLTTVLALGLQGCGEDAGTGSGGAAGAAPSTDEFCETYSEIFDANSGSAFIAWGKRMDGVGHPSAMPAPAVRGLESVIAASTSIDSEAGRKEIRADPELNEQSSDRTELDQWVQDNCPQVFEHTN